ncbi:MAG: protein kinase [Gemmatimonadales bacterium]
MICEQCKTPIPANSRFCLQCGADTSDPGTGSRTQAGSTFDLFSQLRAAVVERYELKELLGRGGMGAVFLGVDRKLDRPVAIKVLPPELSHDENVVERFEREARTAAKLDHNNIIPIYSVESHGDFHYFVMKYVSGRSLEEILDAGPMPVELARRIIWDAACALGHAHQRGIVHRDIKPANIMIDDEGRTMLADFGISKALESATQQLTATGQVVGTPHYMSPEQGKGIEVDGRSDQYSLAVVAYRMLTDVLPFDENSVHAVLYKKIFEDPTRIDLLREDVPGYLVEAVHKALSREPENRFQTMEEFATAIWPENPVSAAGATGRPSRSAIEGETQISPVIGERRRSRKGLIAATAVVVLAGSASAGAWYLNNRQDRATVALATPPDSLRVAASKPKPVQSAESVTVDTNSTAGRQEQAPPPVTKTVAAGKARPPRGRGNGNQRRKPPVQPPAAPKVGYVSINATPYGTVWIDGIQIQDTPLARHELPVGRHILEVRREGYKTVVDTVMVTAGRVIRRQKTLVKEQQ